MLLTLLACALEAEAPKAETDLDADGSPASADCDDADPSRTPGVDETCDGIDNDCDERVDDDPVDGEPWHPDADGDGFGDATVTETACTAPEGFLGDGTDCDDADAEIAPGVPELCDGVDQDCDGATDEEPVDGVTWYADTDGDGAGDAIVPVVACDAPAGHVAAADDCDDADSSIPAAAEVCDNDIDETCDGNADEGCPRSGAATTAEATVVLTGGAGDGAGTSMAVGDVTGDEVADILVAALGDDDAGEDYGALWIAEGTATGTLLDAAIAKWYDGYGNPGFPNDVEVIGDGQGDGIAEIGTLSQGAERCWGIPGGGDLPVSTEVYNYPGRTQVDGSANEPSTMATEHDWDGDGYADLLCGLRDYSGNSWIKGLSMDGPTETHDVTYFSDLNSISGVGDVTGDGYEDVLVGSTSGAYLLSGGGTGSSTVASRTITTYGGGTADESAGWRGAPVGDLDGDGKPELAISGPYADQDLAEAGAVYIVDGSVTGTVLVNSGLSVLHTFTGEGYQDHFGLYVSDGADHDGDGEIDLLVGSPDAGDGGAAWLFYGPWDAEEPAAGADFVVTGADGEDAGTDVRLGHDVTGDGIADIVMAAPGAGSGAGAVAIFAGP